MERCWILAVLCVAIVAAQEPHPLVTAYEFGGIKQLQILEIRKVNRDSCPSGREHDVNVLLADHDSLPGLATWTLTVITSNSDNKTTIVAISEDQTGLQFSASVDGMTSVFVEAMDSSQTRLGVAYATMEARVMDSRLAWVGGDHDSAGSSLRVWPGSQVEVSVGAEVCRRDYNNNAPCYYLDAILPHHISRCLEDETAPKEGGQPIKQCDDVISQFQDIGHSPKMMLLEGNLTIEIQLPETPAKIEAVVYDPHDPSQVFSPEGFQCRVLPDEYGTSHESNTVYCRQTLTDTGSPEHLMVIIVGLDKEGYVMYSRKELYDGNQHIREDDNTGLIVGCVVGGICGVAIIVAIIVYFMKEKNKKSAKGKGVRKSGGSDRSTGGGYEKAATSEPAPPSTDPPTTTTPMTTTNTQDEHTQDEHTQEEA